MRESVARRTRGVDAEYVGARRTSADHEDIEHLGQPASPRLCRPQRSEPDPLDEAVHFLFDDTTLSDDPDRALGLFLLDNEEVESVYRVVSALDQVLLIYGTERSDAFYLQQPEWKAVTQRRRQLTISYADGVLAVPRRRSSPRIEVRPHPATYGVREQARHIADVSRAVLAGAPSRGGAGVGWPAWTWR